MNDMPTFQVPREYKKKGAPQRGLYFFTPKKIELHSFCEKLHLAFKAVNASPYEKNLHALEFCVEHNDEQTLISTAQAIQAICEQNGIVLIIKNNVTLASLIEADGVHLYPENTNGYTIDEARELIGSEAIIGINCGHNKDQAIRDAEQAIDFVSFNDFFNSAGTSISHAELAILEWWSAFSMLPSLATGKITPENCGSLIHAGATFIGVPTDLWKTPKSIGKKVTDFINAIESALHKQKLN